LDFPAIAALKEAWLEIPPAPLQLARIANVLGIPKLEAPKVAKTDDKEDLAEFLRMFQAIGGTVQ
jgi:hypothetical protein